MDAFTKTKQQVLDELGVSEQKGLSEEQAVDNAVRFGVNQLSRPPQESLLKKIWNNLTEPMVLMLVIAAIIAFGVNYARGLNGDETEYIECVGIIAAIFLSVAISLIMEGKSAKAFEALNKMKDDIPAKVFRNGKVRLISQKDIVVGDIVCLGTGAKVPADGRLLESVDLRVEEASLTGESEAVKKDADAVFPIRKHRWPTGRTCFIREHSSRPVPAPWSSRLSATKRNSARLPKNCPLRKKA